MAPCWRPFIQKCFDSFLDVGCLQKLAAVQFLGILKRLLESFQRQRPQTLHSHAQHCSALFREVVHESLQLNIELVRRANSIDQPHGIGFVRRKASSGENHFRGPVITNQLGNRANATGG